MDGLLHWLQNLQLDCKLNCNASFQGIKKKECWLLYFFEHNCFQLFSSPHQFSPLFTNQIFSFKNFSNEKWISGNVQKKYARFQPSKKVQRDERKKARRVIRIDASPSIIPNKQFELIDSMLTHSCNQVTVQYSLNHSVTAYICPLRYHISISWAISLLLLIYSLFVNYYYRHCYHN